MDLIVQANAKSSVWEATVEKSEVFEGHERFKEGNEDVKDDGWFMCPKCDK